MRGVTIVPTFLDNLKSQSTITTEVFGLYFAPESANGELTLGGL